MKDMGASSSHINGYNTVCGAEIAVSMQLVYTFTNSHQIMQFWNLISKMIRRDTMLLAAIGK